MASSTDSNLVAEKTKRALLIGINYEKPDGGDRDSLAEPDLPHATLCVPHRDVTELKKLLVGTWLPRRRNVTS